MWTEKPEAGEEGWQLSSWILQYLVEKILYYDLSTKNLVASDISGVIFFSLK